MPKARITITAVNSIMQLAKCIKRAGFGVYSVEVDVILGLTAAQLGDLIACFIKGALLGAPQCRAVKRATWHGLSPGKIVHFSVRLGDSM